MKTSAIINNTTNKSEDNYIYIYSPIYYSNCSAFYGTGYSKNLSSRNLNPRNFSFTPRSLSKIKKEEQEEIKEFQNEFYGQRVLTEQNNSSLLNLNKNYKKNNRNNNVINIINSIIDPPLSERNIYNNNNIFTYKIKNNYKKNSFIQNERYPSNRSLNISINKEKKENSLKNNSLNLFDKNDKIYNGSIKINISDKNIKTKIKNIFFNKNNNTSNNNINEKISENIEINNDNNNNNNNDTLTIVENNNNNNNDKIDNNNINNNDKIDNNNNNKKKDKNKHNKKKKNKNKNNNTNNNNNLNNNNNENNNNNLNTKNNNDNNNENDNYFNIKNEEKKIIKNKTLPILSDENNEVNNQNPNKFIIKLITPDNLEINESSQFNKLNTFNNTPSLFKTKNKKKKEMPINKSKTNNFPSNSENKDSSNNNNEENVIKKTKTKKNNENKSEDKLPIFKNKSENFNKKGKNSLHLSKTPRNAPSKGNLYKKNNENKKRNSKNKEKENDNNNLVDNQNVNNNTNNENNKSKKNKKENEILNCSTFYERPRSPKHKTFNKIYTLNLEKKYDNIIEDLKNNKHHKNNNLLSLSYKNKDIKREKSSPNLKKNFKYNNEQKINTNKTFKNTHKTIDKEDEKNTKDKHHISNPNLPVTQLNKNNNNNNSIESNLPRRNTKSNNEFKTFTNTEVISSFYEYTINCMEMILELDKDKQPKLTTKVDFNFPENNKKIALFDLDETLIHCTGEIKSNDTEKKYQNSIYITLPNKKRVQVGLNIRPYWKEALDMISNKYNIVIYTASHNSYADAVLNFMDPEKKYSKYRLYRSNCVQANVDGVKFYVKDLSTFDKNYNLKNIIIVDNSVLSFAYHLDNGIPIVPYYDSDEDGELLILAYYLNNIYEYDDLRIANRKHIKIELFLNAARKELAEFSEKEEEEEDDSEKIEEVAKKDNANDAKKESDKTNDDNKDKANNDNDKDKNKKAEDNNKENKVTFNSNDNILKNRSSRKIADITLQRRKNFLRKKTLVSFDIKKMWKDFKYEFKEKKENENLKK